MDSGFFTAITVERSITRLFGGNLDLGIRLLTLELFDVALEQWGVFLYTVRDDSVWRTRHRTVEDATLLSHDLQHVSDFARAIGA